MEIKLFTQILSDKNITDYKKMKYKYKDNFSEFLENLESILYRKIPLKDFAGENIVYIPELVRTQKNIDKLLLLQRNKNYSMKAAEEEIISSCAIEGIDFSRDSVRNILKGYGPSDEQEIRILGQKKAIDFISDTSNQINEENIYKLYMMTIGEFLDDENRLKEGNMYRHDGVYVVGNQGVEHSGVNHTLLPEYMQALVKFINEDDDINELLKAAVIHFYIAYLHPYFDGNGRMARLVHLWYLLRNGYRSALYVTFSSKINKSKKAYYDAFTQIEENAKLSGKIDVTPFLIYFANEVYGKITNEECGTTNITLYENAVKDGLVTKKEAELWQFVLSVYGSDEFSTKQLEKDFGNAAYATIRAFVLKFEKLSLLSSQKYGVRVKYKIN